jgi:serine/threonine-protein kinase
VNPEQGGIYVPAGWFLAGGDAEAHLAGPAVRLWCHGFVIQRDPVDNASFITFLDDLVSQGREEEALAWAPRERSSRESETGEPIFGRDADGRFILKEDGDGDRWEPDLPVVMVTWSGARAYAHWLSLRTGLPWRLPCELEFEKAARGVDGRFYPWGDWLSSSWTNIRTSRRRGQRPMPPDAFPVDASPYGVRGLGGNVRCWCLDADDGEVPLVPGSRVAVPDVDQQDPSAQRFFRGGAWGGVARSSRSAYRFSAQPWFRLADLGIRLVRPIGS